MKIILTLILIFTVQIAFCQSFNQGDPVQIEWKGKWYPGKIVSVKGDKYTISYDGYDASWNETVGIDRLKAPGTTTTTSDVTNTTNTTNTTTSDQTKWSLIGVETIQDLAPSPDGKYILAVSSYSKLYVLNASDLTIAGEINVSKIAIFTATWSRDGEYIATGDYNGKAIIYKRKEGIQFEEYDSLAGYSSIFKMRFSPVNNDLLLSASPKADYTDTQIDIWDIKKRKIKYNLLTSTNADHSISDIVWSHDGSKIAVGISNKKKGILIYDSTGKSLSVIPHTHDVVSLDFSPDNKLLASGGIDGKVSLWDLSTQKIMWSTLWKKSSSDYIYGIAFSPDGLSIAACGMGYGPPVIIFDKTTGKKSKELGTSNSNGNAIVFSDDSKYLFLANTTYGDVFKVPIVVKYKIPE